MTSRGTLVLEPAIAATVRFNKSALLTKIADSALFLEGGIILLYTVVSRSHTHEREALRARGCGSARLGGTMKRKYSRAALRKILKGKRGVNLSKSVDIVVGYNAS